MVHAREYEYGSLVWDFPVYFNALPYTVGVGMITLVLVHPVVCKNYKTTV